MVAILWSNSLVIGNAAVNDSFLAGVNNNERQLDGWVGSRGTLRLLQVSVSLHQVFKCYLLQMTRGRWNLNATCCRWQEEDGIYTLFAAVDKRKMEFTCYLLQLTRGRWNLHAICCSWQEEDGIYMLFAAVDKRKMEFTCYLLQLTRGRWNLNAICCSWQEEDGS